LPTACTSPIDPLGSSQPIGAVRIPGAPSVGRYVWVDARADMSAGTVCRRIPNKTQLEPSEFGRRSQRVRFGAFSMKPRISDGSASPASATAMGHRNAEIARRYEAGETLTLIGSTLGLSRERVRQILKSSGVLMPYERSCKVDGCPTTPPRPLAYCAAHQRRLDRYGDPVGTRRSLPPPIRDHGTYAMYRAGCRCDLCRAANAGKSRELNHRRYPEWRYAPEKWRAPSHP
jgi:DNA-binding CsgD family transcriptional regulator